MENKSGKIFKYGLRICDHLSNYNLSTVSFYYMHFPTDKSVDKNSHERALRHIGLKQVRFEQTPVVSALKSVPLLNTVCRCPIVQNAHLNRIRSGVNYIVRESQEFISLIRPMPI